MPRSTTTVAPGFWPVRFCKLSNISPTVVRSWRLPSKTSCALGKPSRSSTRLAIGPLIPRVAALGLRRVARGLALEVSRGQIVQIQSVVEMKQRLLALGQRRFDVLAVRVQSVQVAIQSIVVQRGKIHAQKVGQSGTLQDFIQS